MKNLIRSFKNKIVTIYLKIKYGKKVTFNGTQRIHTSTKIDIDYGGLLVLDHFVDTREHVCFSVRNGAKLEIGERVFFNRNCLVACRGSITIGDKCRFGPNVCIYDHNHKFDYSGILPQYSVGGVTIGNDCWIGANVTILKDTIIGEKSVIGAGAVVQGNIPAHSIVKSNRELEIIPIRKE